MYGRLWTKGGKRPGQTHRKDGHPVVDTKGMRQSALGESQRVNFVCQTELYVRVVKAAHKRGESVSTFIRAALVERQKKSA